MNEAIQQRAPAPGLIVAVGLPLVVLGIAYVLWAISDRLVQIGPFDRAAFGWAFVVPTWIAAPIATGVTWWRTPTPRVARAAVVVVICVTAAAAWSLWKAVSTPDCGDLGALRAPSAMIAPSVVVGLVLGGGIVASGLVTRAALLRGARARALVVGLIASVVTSLISIIAMLAMVGSQNCNRPTIL